MQITKQQAMEAVSGGSKVTHRHFSSSEWMAKHDDQTFVFEDGVKVSHADFFSLRNDSSWDDGYSIVDPNS